MCMAIRAVAGFALSVLMASGGLQAAEGVGDKKSRVPQPSVNIVQGDKCVEPTDVMRRDHMKYILHQRDATMHKGIRTTKHSLKNCISCHADPKTNSVLGKDGFCESCHAYAAVSMDCFSCHTPSPEKKAAQTGAGTEKAGARASGALIMDVSTTLAAPAAASR